MSTSSPQPIPSAITSALGRWLADHREPLVAQWQPYTAPHPGDEHNGTAYADEHAVLMASLYHSLIEAADGDFAPLDQCLHLLRALRSHTNEDQLPQHLTLIFRLRRAAVDLLYASAADDCDRRALLGELEHLADEAALRITQIWTSAANNVTMQLEQTEMLITNLNAANAETDRLVLQIASLNDMARILSSSFDVQYLLSTVGEKLIDALGVAHLSIWMPQGDVLCLAHSWGDAEYPSGMCLPLDSTDVVVRAYVQSASVLDLAPGETQGAWHQSACAVFAVPLRAQAHANGVLVLQDPDPDSTFHLSLRHFVDSAASQMAIALQNAYLYGEVRSFNAVLEQRIAERTRELQTERDMLETVHQIALEISSTLDIDTLLASSLQMLADIIGVDHGSVMLVDNETDQLVNRAVLGRRSQNYTRMPVGHGIAGWVAHHKKPALVADVAEDDRWIDLPSSDEIRKRLGSMITVPLIVQNDVLGVLQLSHHTTSFFTQDHLRLLSAVAGEVALGVHNALLYEQIQQQLMRQGDMLRNERRSTTQSTAILQSLSDGVIVCDTEGNVITANPAVERVMDYPLEELVVLNINDLFAKLIGKQSRTIPFNDLLAHPLDARGQPRTFTTRLEIGRRQVRLTLDPVLLRVDDVMGAVAVLRDITREVESERVKDEFIGTVSHELRTPMTSIKGYTQLLSMSSLGPVNASQREFLQTIMMNADRMITIINDLLDITKIETGTVELNMRPIHVAEALGTVVTELQSLLASRQHELVITIPPGVAFIRADAHRFDQVLSNLVSNAAKYTPPGGTITVEVHEVTEEQVPEDKREGLRRGRYVQVDVRDTGIGIPPAEQEAIFERFYRTENPLKIEAGGTGLGLALVRPLVRLFGGRLWFYSVPGEGSVFSFVIPAIT